MQLLKTNIVRILIILLGIGVLIIFVAIPQRSSIPSTKGNLVSEIASKYGGAFQVEVDSKTGTIRKLRGSSIPVSNLTPDISQVDKRHASSIVKTFVANNPKLGIDPAQLEETKTWDNEIGPASNKKQLIISHHVQKYKGLRVYKSKLTTVFSKDALTYLETTYLPVDLLEVTPLITSEEASVIAKSDIANNPQAKPNLLQDQRKSPLSKPIKEPKSELLIYPIEHNSGYEYRLAWQLRFGLIKGFGTSPIYLIDAKTGELLLRRETLLDQNPSGKIAGTIYPISPLQGNEDVYLSEVPVYEDESCFAFSDSNGDFQLPCSSPSYFTADIGPFVPESESPVYGSTVIANSEFEWGFTFTGINVPAPDTDIYLNDTSENNHLTNVFYHVNYAKEFFNNGGAFDIPGSFEDLFVIIFPADEVYLGVVCNAFAIAFEADEFEPISGSTLGGVLAFTFNEDSFTSDDGRVISCESSYLLADVIYHEVGHLVTEFIYSNAGGEMLGSDGEGGTINEGVSDYWAGMLTNDPMIVEHILIDDEPALLRDLSAGMRYENWAQGDAHTNAPIIGGALWDFKENMVRMYGEIGLTWANEMIISAIKLTPTTFSDFFRKLLVIDQSGNYASGTSVQSLICDAFLTRHGIPDLDGSCNGTLPPPFPDIPPTPVRTPTPTMTPRPNANVMAPVAGDIVANGTDLKIIGDAKGSGFQSYTIEQRPYGGNWSSSNISLTNGGTSSVELGRLGNLNTTGFKNGCFYEIKVTVNKTSGTESYSTYIKNVNTTIDPMPRMVAVYRTGQEGAENDAAEVIALVSDPKPIYHTLPANDWRRGRFWRLWTGSNVQIGRNGMCDPNWQSDCAKDCWNIVGTNGHAHGGNDGLDLVFCAPWDSSCTTAAPPPSFSGCPSENMSCINEALRTLEEVYHKVVYFHWAKEDWGSYSIVNCANDRGRHEYIKTTYNTDNPWRVGQCSKPRCSLATPNDLLDGFDKLKTNLATMQFYDYDFTEKPRVIETPKVNCATCGCPADRPNCDPVTDTCTAPTCADGTPYGKCKVNWPYATYCDNGAMRQVCGYSCDLGNHPPPICYPYQQCVGGNCIPCTFDFPPNPLCYNHYVCGDADGNNLITISDAVFLITYLFADGASPPNPLLRGDANKDGQISISDPVYLINYSFAGGPAPCGPPSTLKLKSKLNGLKNNRTSSSLVEKVKRLLLKAKKSGSKRFARRTIQVLKSSWIRKGHVI